MAILPSQRTEFLGYGQSNTRSSTCDECDLLFSDSIAWSVFVSVSNLFHLCMPSISTRLPSGACFFSSMPQHWMHGVRLCPIHPRHPSLGRFVCLSHVRRVSPFTVQSTCHVSTSSWQTTCMRTSPRSTSSRNGLVIVSLCRCVRWSIQLDPGGQGRRREGGLDGRGMETTPHTTALGRVGHGTQPKGQEMKDGRGWVRLGRKKGCHYTLTTHTHETKKTRVVDRFRRRHHASLRWSREACGTQMSRGSKCMGSNAANAQLSKR